MRIWTDEEAGEQVLFVACDTDKEAEWLNDFTRIDTPLVAVLKHETSYLHPHIEIRKGRTET